MMNELTIHILIGIIQFVGLPIVVFFRCLSVYFKNSQMLRCMNFAIIIFGILTLATYYTGNVALILIDGFPAVNDLINESHQNLSLALLYSTLLLSVCCGIDIFLRTNKYFKKTVLMLSVSVAILNITTGYQGLKIRHTELRNQRQNFSN